jgi:hypothetical protein
MSETEGKILRPRFSLAQFAIATTVVVAACVLPALGVSAARPVYVVAAMILCALGFVYGIWLGFAPREWFALIVFWTLYASIMIIEWSLDDDSSLEAMQVGLFCANVFCWLMAFCAAILAISGASRCKRIKGTYLPFINRKQAGS